MPKESQLEIEGSGAESEPPLPEPPPELALEPPPSLPQPSPRYLRRAAYLMAAQQVTALQDLLERDDRESELLGPAIGHVNPLRRLLLALGAE